MSDSSKNNIISFTGVSIMIAGTIVSFTGVSIMGLYRYYRRPYYNNTSYNEAKHEDYRNIIRLWFN
jgi:hypothetical protein